MVHSRYSLAVLLAASWMIAGGGCEKTEEIARYTVAKPPPIEAANNARPGGTADEPPGEPTDRTLAAIVPRQGQGWFFKLTGPKDAVAAQADPFTALVKSVQFTADGKPRWTLPDGWQEQPGSQLRYATLVIPGGEKPLEVSVTALPNPGDDEAGYVLVNVNRWRGQLKLPPIAADQLAGESTRLELDGATATLVNLLGTAAPNSMGRPPLMSGARDGK